MKWPILTATLRFLGFKSVAIAIHKANPGIQLTGTAYTSSRKYITPNGYLKKNTPLHIQLDLLNWDDVTRIINPSADTTDFYKIYDKLEELTKKPKPRNTNNDKIRS